MGYFLDGIPYSATGLAVSAEQTPNLVATHDGFACDGFFSGDTLEPIEPPRTRFSSSTGVEIARVRIEVKTRDIWSVAEFVHGVQHDLFLNAEVLINRKGAFENKRAINKIGLALACLTVLSRTRSHQGDSIQSPCESNEATATVLAKARTPSPVWLD